MHDLAPANDGRMRVLGVVPREACAGVGDVIHELPGREHSRQLLQFVLGLTARTLVLVLWNESALCESNGKCALGQLGLLAQATAALDAELPSRLTRIPHGDGRISALEAAEGERNVVRHEMHAI